MCISGSIVLYISNHGPSGGAHHFLPLLRIQHPLGEGIAGATPNVTSPPADQNFMKVWPAYEGSDERLFYAAQGGNDTEPAAPLSFNAYDYRRDIEDMPSADSNGQPPWQPTSARVFTHDGADGKQDYDLPVSGSRTRRASGSVALSSMFKAWVTALSNAWEYLNRGSIQFVYVSFLQTAYVFLTCCMMWKGKKATYATNRFAYAMFIIGLLLGDAAVKIFNAIEAELTGDPDEHGMVQLSAKWIATGECLEETNDFHEYVQALAGHDMYHGTSVHLAAALQSDAQGVANLPQYLSDLASFFRWQISSPGCLLQMPFARGSLLGAPGGWVDAFFQDG
ncbi:unnamed protein product, partial [Prorocentrum cordatum]